MLWSPSRHAGNQLFWRQENLVIVRHNLMASLPILARLSSSQAPLVFLLPQSFLVESAFESFICIHCRFSTKHLDSTDEKKTSSHTTPRSQAIAP